MLPAQLVVGLMWFVVLLFSLSFHEASHAWMARRIGDHTAEHEGRITLNPLAHIDPLGTVVLPLIQFFTGAALIGWAKPTPYNPGNFNRNVSLARGHVLVAVAGPLSNMILALGFTAILFVMVRVFGVSGQDSAPRMLLDLGISTNVALGIFNLIPIPPLDGSKVASWGLPRSLGEAYDRVFEPLGQWLLLLLVMTRVLGWIMRPIIDVVLNFLYAVIG